MDFPASGGPTKMDRVTATDTEPCFLMDSSYADRHSEKAKGKGLCTMTHEEYCSNGGCSLAPCQVECEQAKRGH